MTRTKQHVHSRSKMEPTENRLFNKSQPKPKYLLKMLLTIPNKYDSICINDVYGEYSLEL